MQFIRFIRDQVAALLREESGQDTFEYLLIIGGISVAVVVAVAIAAPGLIGQVVDGVCTAIRDGIDFMSGMNCGDGGGE